MAKFSKAHYVILAEVFKKSVEQINAQTFFNYSGFFDDLRQNLIEKLQQDNPKFDASRFIKASEPEANR